MRKVAIVLGFVLLLFVFSSPQWGIGQMGMTGEKQPPPEQMVIQMGKPPDLDKEIELLRFIDLMELSQNQLMDLQNIVSDLFTAESEVAKIQHEFEDFLLGFQGDQGELDQEFASYRERLKNARDALNAKEGEVAVKIIDLLSGQDRDALTNFLLESYIRKSVLPDLGMLAYLIDMKMERLQGPNKSNK